MPERPINRTYTITITDNATGQVMRSAHVDGNQANRIRFITDERPANVIATDIARKVRAVLVTNAKWAADGYPIAASFITSDYENGTFLTEDFLTLHYGSGVSVEVQPDWSVMPVDIDDDIDELLSEYANAVGKAYMNDDHRLTVNLETGKVGLCNASEWNDHYPHLTKGQFDRPLGEKV